LNSGYRLDMQCMTAIIDQMIQLKGPRGRTPEMISTDPFTGKHGELRPADLDEIQTSA
jgi:hypothetical protein